MKKNVAGQTWLAFAFNRASGNPVTGDAANITALISKDHGTATALATPSPTEIAAGYYRFTLTQAETNADALDLIVTSATSGVQASAIDPRLYPSVGTGDGEFPVTVNVYNADIVSIAGASITIRDSLDQVVAVSRTPTSGARLFGLDAGTYSALVSATGYDAQTVAMVVSATDTFDVELVATVVDEPEVDTTYGPNFRVASAVDWELPFVIGSLAGTWSQLRFTAKTSPTQQTDAQAVIQVRLTSGGAAGDGLIVLNGAATTAAWAEIVITDTATGTGSVKIKAIATTAVPSTAQEYWEITDEGLETQRAYRTSTVITPPVLHWDVKRLDGSGNASPVRPQGLLVVSTAVTKDVVS